MLLYALEQRNIRKKIEKFVFLLTNCGRLQIFSEFEPEVTGRTDVDEVSKYLREVIRPETWNFYLPQIHICRQQCWICVSTAFNFQY